MILLTLSQKNELMQNGINSILLYTAILLHLTDTK